MAALTKRHEAVDVCSPTWSGPTWPQHERMACALAGALLFDGLRARGGFEGEVATTSSSSTPRWALRTFSKKRSERTYSE